MSIYIYNVYIYIMCIYIYIYNVYIYMYNVCIYIYIYMYTLLYLRSSLWLNRLTACTCIQIVLRDLHIRRLVQLSPVQDFRWQRFFRSSQRPAVEDWGIVVEVVPRAKRECLDLREVFPQSRNDLSMTTIFFHS